MIWLSLKPCRYLKLPRRCLCPHKHLRVPTFPFVRAQSGSKNIARWGSNHQDLVEVGGRIKYVLANRKNVCMIVGIGFCILPAHNRFLQSGLRRRRKRFCSDRHWDRKDTLPERFLNYGLRYSYPTLYLQFLSPALHPEISPPDHERTKRRVL